jgi:hypothetical protein
LFPFYSPWWGPFGFGGGFPRWGYAWGGGLGWYPGFGWGRGFGWGPGFGWGGLRAFNFYGRWGHSAFIGAPVGWAGGRFAVNQPGGIGRFGTGRPEIGNTRSLGNSPRGTFPNPGLGNPRSGRLGNTRNGQFSNPGNRAFGNSGNRMINTSPRSSGPGNPGGSYGSAGGSRAFSAPRSSGFSGHMGGGGMNGGARGGGGGGGRHH